MDIADLGCLPSSQPSFPVHLCIALLLPTVEECLEHYRPVEETRHTINTSSAKAVFAIKGNSCPGLGKG